MYSERLASRGIAPSVGTVGDSFDNAMAESAMELYETELIRRLLPNPGRFISPVILTDYTSANSAVPKTTSDFEAGS